MGGLIRAAIPILVAGGTRLMQATVMSPGAERAAQVLVKGGDPLQKVIKIAGDEFALTEQAAQKASVAMPAITRVAGNAGSKVAPRTTEVFKAAGTKAGDSAKAAIKGKPTPATGKCSEQMFAEKIAAEQQAAARFESVRQAGEKMANEKMLQRLAESEALLDKLKRPYMY